MNSISRRNFLRSASAVGAGVAFIPNFISCSSPSGKVNIAAIGAGGRGAHNINECATENIVALCDVDENRAAGMFNKFPDAKRYSDFRKMFDEMGNEIDAVLISTPDHTHFAAAMAAMQLGKHVYVEKPLAHNIWQLRTL
ncbi:MAG TPA: Gfo/Idh/MocA family oxidoreductase, partial [Prolixibacteraceae bacterium]|nr:Gfo/Idh/MocA family oxidoreductase [Prolixibacteraceae bacterium]